MNAFFESLKTQFLDDVRTSETAAKLVYVFSAKNAMSRQYLQGEFNLQTSDQKRFRNVDMLRGGYFADEKNMGLTPDFE